MLPTKDKLISAGFSVAALETTTITSGSQGIIRTGIAASYPPGTYGRIAPRAQPLPHPCVTVYESMIEPGYNGEIKVLIFNHSETDYA